MFGTLDMFATQVLLRPVYLRLKIPHSDQKYDNVFCRSMSAGLKKIRSKKNVTCSAGISSPRNTESA